MYSPEEAARRAQVMSEAQKIYGETKGDYAQYPGSAPIAPSAETLSAENYLRAVVPGQVGNVQSMQQAVNFGLGDVLYPGSNPALRQTIAASVRPITESYVDPGGVMSQIRTGAGQAGQYGSSRQGVAEGIAAGRYADAVGDTAAKVATEGYNKGLDTFGRTLAFTPQALGATSFPAQTLASVGASVEGRAQEQAAFEEAQRMWGINYPWIPLQNYANIVYGGGSSGSTAKTSGGGMTSGQQLAGGLSGAMTGLSMAGMLGSIPGLAGAGGAGGAALAMSGGLGIGLAGLGLLAGSGIF
jgi:hypothetical protein